MRTRNKAGKKPESGKPKTGKKKPLAEERSTNAVRHLILNGAFFRCRVTDEEHGELLKKGKLGEDFEIKRRGMVSNPVIIGKVEFEGMKDIEIELEISGDSFRASKTLAEAGVAEKIVEKVGQIEFGLQIGEHELVDELCGCGFDSFMGSIEGAIAKSGKKED